MTKTNPIHSDEVSELYRKYAIGIVVNGKIFYGLWGTDMSNELDKLLTNGNGKILLFETIRILVDHIKRNANRIFDSKNSQLWSENFAESRPYVQYDIDALEKYLNGPISGLPLISRSNAMEIVNFLNLMGDYADQAKKLEITNLLEDDNTKAFFDFAYDNFFWKNEIRGIELVSEFDITEAYSNILKLISLFKSSLHYSLEAN